MRKLKLNWRLGVALAASSLFLAQPGLANDKKKGEGKPAAQAPRPAPQPAAQPKPQPQPQPQVVQPKPQPQPVLQPKPQPQPQPVVQPKPQPQPTPQVVQPKPQPTPQPQPVVQPHSTSKPKINIQQFLPPAGNQPQNQGGSQFRGNSGIIQPGSNGGMRDNDRRRDDDRRGGNFNNNFNAPQQHHDHDHDHGLSTKQVILYGLIRSLATPQPRPGYYSGYYGSGYYGYGPAGGYRSPYYTNQPTVVYAQPQTIIVDQQPQTVVPNYQPNDPSVAPPSNETLYVPTADQLAEIPDAPLRDILLEALNRFETELNTLTTGDSWKKHLQTSTIGSLLTEKDGSPNAATRERLRRLVGGFDDLSRDSKYTQVTSMWGFKTVRVGLKVYTAEPELKLRKQIAGAAAAFDRGLDSVDTGDSWKSHLRLTHLRSLSETTDENRAGRIEELTALGERFDKVASNESYSVISSKPGFGEAREMLKQYVAVISAPRGADGGDIPPPSDDVAPPAPKKEDVAPPSPKKEDIAPPSPTSSKDESVPPQPESRESDK